MKKFNWFEAILKQPIEMLELPDDVTAKLKASGKTIVFDLTECSRAKLAEILNTKDVEHIVEILEGLGYEYEGDYRPSYEGKMFYGDMLEIKQRMIFSKKKTYDELLDTPIKDLMLNYVHKEKLMNFDITTIRSLIGYPINKLKNLTIVDEYTKAPVLDIYWHSVVDRIKKIMQSIGFEYKDNDSLPIYKGKLKMVGEFSTFNVPQVNMSEGFIDNRSIIEKLTSPTRTKTDLYQGKISQEQALIAMYKARINKISYAGHFSLNEWNNMLYWIWEDINNDTRLSQNAKSVLRKAVEAKKSEARLRIL